MRWWWFPVVLSGCAVQTPVIDQLDVQLEQLMGSPVAAVSAKLGEPAVQEPSKGLTRYRWRQADLVKPCEIELWADDKGLIRQARWSGYDRSCKPLVSRLTP